jgi:hypothetical protein
MEQKTYVNKNKGKLFQSNGNQSVETELAATGNIFDANENKYKVALIKEIYNGDTANAKRYIYLRVGIAFPNKSENENAPIFSGGFQLPRHWNEEFIDPNDKGAMDSARARRRDQGKELRIAYFLNNDGLGLELSPFNQNKEEKSSQKFVDNNTEESDIPF